MRALMLAPITAGWLTLLGCACPEVVCTTWAKVDVTATAWQQGTYTVTVVVGEATLSCAIDVLEDGVTPLLWDQQCGDNVVYANSVYDTGGSLVPDLLEYQVAIGEDARPATAAVTVVHVSPAGSETLVDGPVTLTWSDRLAPGGSCQTGCATTQIAIALPRR